MHHETFISSILFMKHMLTDDLVDLEMELDEHRYNFARERAVELVREYGWTEKDDDFWLQVHEETKRLWDEEYDREMERVMAFEEFEKEEAMDRR